MRRAGPLSLQPVVGIDAVNRLRAVPRQHASEIIIHLKVCAMRPRVPPRACASLFIWSRRRR
jgi:hypothetical protein